MNDMEEKVSAFCTKVGLSETQYQEEYSKEEKNYIDNDLEVKPEVIFRKIKARYSTSVRSNAVWYNGFFFGVCKAYDQAALTWEEDVAPRLEYYQNKYGENWIAEAEKAGEVNSDGEPIWHAGNCQYDWMHGMIIPQSEPKRKLLAILTNAEGQTNFTVMYAPAATFTPVPGQRYKFRGSKIKGNKGYWVVNTTTVSRLIEDGGFVPYEEATNLIAEYVNDQIMPFEDTYDLNQLTVVTKEFPSALRFTVTDAMIAGITITDPSKFQNPAQAIDYVEIADMMEDFENNVSVRAEKGIGFNMANESLGIAVIEPYFSKPQNGDPPYPSGNLIGFILNEKLSPIVKTEPNTTVLSSEFD